MSPQTLTEAPATDPTEYSEIFGISPKSADIETHVRIARCDGEIFIDSRDYIISLGKYGRGYKVPLDEAMDYAMYVQLAAAAELGIDLP